MREMQNLKQNKLNDECFNFDKYFRLNKTLVLLNYDCIKLYTIALTNFYACNRFVIV